MSTKKILTSKEYVAALGNECPACGSGQIQNHSPLEADSGTAWQEVVCHDCGYKWTDIYTLTGFEDTL